MSKHKTSPLHTSVFFVSGLHCASCELIIEKKLNKIPQIETADVNLQNNKLIIVHHKDFKISSASLNEIFRDDGYKFSLNPLKNDNHNSACEVDCQTNSSVRSLPKSILIAILFIFGFIILNQTGFSSWVTVSDGSSLPVFFLFGLLAGFSSCAALTGGVILSLSKQWLSLYGKSESFLQKSEPHFLFNLGRLGSYLLLGAFLGYLGNFFRLSPVFTAFLVIAISVVMVLLGLQMLGVKALQNFRLSLPRSLTRRISDESNFQGKYAPFIMGALTFFLPCGFTITAQALALASGDAFQGALIMGLFALGTLPGLLAIGLSSVKFQSNPRTAAQFSMVAGLLILFFAAFNVNSQLAVLGAPNLDTVFSSTATAKSTDLTGIAPVVNGVQILKMDASASGYSPNSFKVKAGVPVRWEITDRGTSGCTNAVISRSLFQGQIPLVPGTTSVKEFTPDTPGTYRFSCWMGMITGTIVVVDDTGTAPAANTEPVVQNSGGGCGCGGGGSAGGGSCH